MMTDQDVLAHIGDLVEEEHRLLEQRAGGEAGPDVNRRIEAIEVTLDQCWDLLRQRRARRDFGEDPDDARVRPADTVERYLQ